MRAPVDPARLERLMKELGRRCTGPGRVYLVGGATALLHGWRPTTVDVDLKLDPEPPGAFEAIAELKNELDLNVELAAPDEFIPPLPGWRERSTFIAQYGAVTFLHYDFRAQALAKIERGHDRDLADVHSMVRDGLVRSEELEGAFGAIRAELIRYPRIDGDAFEASLRRFVDEVSE